MDQELNFFCYENDPGFEVALEPEGMTWKVSKNEKIKFLAKNPSESFRWSIRHESNYIQVFHDSQQPFPEIEIFKNDKLIDTV